MNRIIYDPKDLALGIRPDHRVDRNAAGFINILNAMVVAGRLKEFEPVTSAVSSAELTTEGITLDWPFPCLFKGANIHILADKTALYEYDDSTSLLSGITTYDMDDVYTTKSLTAGTRWEAADFWNFIVLTNGSCCAVRWNMPALVGEAARWIVNDSTLFETCCSYRGRLIMAGFDSSNFLSADWEHFFETLSHKFQTRIEFSIQDNFVWYSSAGGGNALWLLMPTLYIDGFIDSRYRSGNFIMDTLARNDSGFFPCAYDGRVKFVRTLGDHLMVYGDEGIQALTHRSSPHSTLGTITMVLGGNEVVRDIGIGVVAVSRSEGRQIFLDVDGWLWEAVPDMHFVKVNRLGYYEKFNSMAGNTVVISHDETNGRFYICDGTDTYLLSSALTKVDQVITSVENFDGQPKGCWVGTAGASDDDFELETNPFDMGSRNLKTIDSIAIVNVEDASTSETAKFAISFKMDKTESTFTTTDYYPFNPDGVGHLTVQGVEFKIHLVFSKYNEQPPPDYIYIYYDKSDVTYREEILSHKVTGERL